uniref:Dysbindin domain-containing protein 1 n=1 Tax=Equus asinus asinus TaxID=83772 RepID=A0A8C4KVH0_EQUAS
MDGSRRGCRMSARGGRSHRAGDGRPRPAPEIVKEVEVPQAALGTPAHGPGDSGHSPVAEEEVGIPIPAPGLLQVTERRQPLSSVSSLEVHFDLLDLTELTDMSDQELAEVFADSDDENLTSESPAGGAGVGAQRAVWGGLGLKTPPALDIASCKPLFLKIIFSQVCV